MRVRFGVLLAVVGGTLSLGAAESSAALEFCERADNGRSCATLTVPLDRSGVVPGTVKLRIERQKAKRSARPPLFLIAGGPGRSATEAFDPDAAKRFFGTEVRSRDVVVMDLRGTGGSGALHCPALQRGSTRARAIAACASKLGPRRDFYSSIDMADDIDAVRAALGAEQIALYGGSYGTYVAQTYARRHPDRIDRLVLDSVVGPLGVDPFERASMAAVPGVVGRWCGQRRCRAFMRDPVGDAARLAARLDQRPLAGYVVNRQGRRRPAKIDGQGLLALMEADAAGFVGSLVPGAIGNALRGDPAPLLRIHDTWSGRSVARSPREFSAAAYVATLCSDTQLPWGDATSPAGRRAAATAFAASQPAGAFTPFGVNTALRSRVLDVCGAWPMASAARPAPAPLPDVPVLLFAGGTDTTTPVENARAVAAEMPRARLIVVANAGHGVLTFDFGNCASSAARRFLAGGDPGSCGGGVPLARPLPAAPASLRDVPFKGHARRTAGAVAFTIFDASVNTSGEFVRRSREAGPRELLRLLDRPIWTGALRAGVYTLSLKRTVTIRLHRASAVPGVRVDGRLRNRRAGFIGALRISGSKAARGRLAIRGVALSGTLGGKRVRMSLKELAAVFGASSSSSAALARATRAARLGPWVDRPSGR